MENKEILAICDILRKNNRYENDCHNVYYIGDGYTDAMNFVHSNGGKAILVHQLNKNDELYYHNQKIYETLNTNGIIDFYCVADYTTSSVLSNILLRQKER